MSESFDNLGTVSEYIEREYKKWDEKYTIPFDDEFNIRLLIQLRYDILTTKPEHTKTKLELIEMTNRIQSRLKLKPIEKVVSTIPMYVDCVNLDTKKGKLKIIIYIDNQIIILDNRTYLNSRDYARTIYELAKSKNSIVYIDIHGFGMVVYDELVGFKDLPVEKLQLINHCK